jgi:DNA repair protein RecO (recombination protein O)
MPAASMIDVSALILKVMPLIETEGLVLRSYNLAEADRIVVFFTREQGIVRGVAKGARRLKSRFGSMLEPFSTVHLTYFQKEERELVSIQQLELIESRFDSAAEPGLLHTLSYLSELLIAVVPPHDPNETMYRMAKACLETGRANASELAALRLYFELWVLRLGGYLPDWSKCDRCFRPLAGEDELTLRADLHLVCRQCRRSSGLTPFTGLMAIAYRDAQKLSPQKFVGVTAKDVETVSALSAVLRRIIAQVVGRDILNESTLAVNS